MRGSEYFKKYLRGLGKRDDNLLRFIFATFILRPWLTKPIRQIARILAHQVAVCFMRLDQLHTDTLAPLLNTKIGKNDFGEHLIVSEWCSTPNPCPIDQSALSLLFPQILKMRHGCTEDPSQWMFLDIETT